MNRLVDSENDDKCTELSDDKHTYRWIKKHTRRRASEHTAQEETISGPSIRQTSSIRENTTERYDKSSEPASSRTSANTATDTVPNEIEYDHRAYRIAYWMASRETAEITTKEITEISQWRTSLPKDFRWRLHETITESYTVPSHWQRWLLNGVLKEQHTFAKWHTKLTTKLNTKWPYPRPTEWPLRSQQILYRSCQPRWPQRCQPRTHRSYHPNDFHWETVLRDPAECQVKKCRDLKMRCTKRLSESRSMLLSWWVWPPTVKLTC